MAAVQRILDRLILIRYADDKEVLLTYDVIEGMLTDYRRKGSYARPDDLMQELIDFSHRMDERHNTTLFQPGHICEQVAVPNEVLEKVMAEMNNISFRKFTSDILGSTYETYLGTKLALRNGEVKSEERRDIRKAGGIYYTPPPIVHYIVDNTLGKLLKELEKEHKLNTIEKVMQIRVLDPACGSGSFLIYAYKLLSDFYRRINEMIDNKRVRLLAQAGSTDMFQRLELFKQLPEPLVDYPHYILEKQLYGVDIDPEAAEIAAVNLTMQAFADARREKLPLILNENVKVGNSLISGTEEELHTYFGDNWQEKKPFKWKEAFPNGGFDVVVGNPPYGAELTTDEKAYLKHNYDCVSDFETAQYFIAVAEQVLKPNGYLAFIIPNTIFLNLYAQRFRRFIADSFRVESVLDLSGSEVFKQATIRTAIPLLVKSNVPNNEVAFLRLEGDETKGILYKTVSQKDLLENDRLWSMGSVDSVITSLLKKLMSQSVPLSSILVISQGLIPYDKYRGHDEQTIKNRIWHADSKKDETFKKELRGGDVRRYFVKWNGKQWISYGPWLAAPRKIDFFTKPRLLFREITDPRSGLLHVAFTEEEFYNNPSLINCIVGDKPYSLKYCLAISNSSLIGYFHFHTSPKVRKGVFPKILVNDVRNLPIRCIDFDKPAEKKKHDELVALADTMLELNNQVAFSENIPSDKQDELSLEIERKDVEINEKVYELYDLTGDEIEIVESRQS
jgi:type I restriction-modification system DNA methylase subunit